MLNESLEVLGSDCMKEQLLSGVFENSSLANAKLPLTLKKIEHNAFKNCNNLKNIKLPGGL